MGRLRLCFPKCRSPRIMNLLQIMLGGLVIIVTVSSLFRFYPTDFFSHNKNTCNHLYGDMNNVYDGFDIHALSDRVNEVLQRMESLQEKLESKVQQMKRNKSILNKTNITRLEYQKFLEEEVIQPLYASHIALRQIRLPKTEMIRNSTIKEDPLINSFTIEEIRKYITPKTNKLGKINIYGTNRVYTTVGHACVSHKQELEEYMSYNIGSYCNDDWHIAQNLMINGCDPLPRRRCLARASKLYRKPHAINGSLWKMPPNGNIRWSNYQCKNFACLSSRNPTREFSKCESCFNLEKEKLKWVTKTSKPTDFLIHDVLATKPGEIRIGLDFGAGTGTFAARMRERDVTIVSTALNLGAPFTDMIALRGLIPLYVTLNQRLPFFDNTMDLIHANGVVDGWMDLVMMDFVLFDWDRVLRPGGLLWIDKFFCTRKDLDDYMYLFLQFRYKKHKWALSRKSEDEVYLSALLEKPTRAV